MEFIPELRIGLFNGWIFLALYLVVFAIVLYTCPKEVRTRLYDRKGWTKTQIAFTVVGKMFSLVNIIIILLAPLKMGTAFVCGVILYTAGLAGLVTAVIHYRDSPLGEPITAGLYRFSRNPQILSIFVSFTGMILVVGSWVSLLFLAVTITGSHFSILGEEKRLTEQYGESYVEYKRKIPRYFLVL